MSKKGGNNVFIRKGRQTVIPVELKCVIQTF